MTDELKKIRSMILSDNIEILLLASQIALSYEFSSDDLNTIYNLMLYKFQKMDISEDPNQKDFHRNLTKLGNKIF